MEALAELRLFIDQKLLREIRMFGTMETRTQINVTTLAAFRDLLRENIRDTLALTGRTLASRETADRETELRQLQSELNLALKQLDAGTADPQKLQEFSLELQRYPFMADV